MGDDTKVEIVVEDRQGGKQEYICEETDERHDTVARRKAYDARLKTNILYSGTDNTMNPSFDPTYDPTYNVPYGYGGYRNGWGGPAGVPYGRQYMG